MSFITNEDRKMHNASKLPSLQQIDPKAFASTDHYLRTVATQLANYARLAYRHGRAAQAQSWVYTSGISDDQISQTLTTAAQEHVGNAQRVIVTAHTASMSQGETSVSLALVITGDRP